MTDTDREQTLDEVIANYLASRDASSTPRREALLAAHPDVAEDLRAFFREHDRLARLAAPPRAAAGLGPSIAIEPTARMTASRPGFPHETLDVASNPGEAQP